MGRLRGTGGVHLLPVLAGVATALLIGLGVWADPFGIVTLVRERSFDTLYVLRPRAPGLSTVTVVDIDDATLAENGPWPLPRAQLGDLVDRIAAGRASVIAFDVFFPAADRNSARSLAARLSALPGGAAIEGLAAGMPDGDAQFAKALRAVPSVVSALAGPTRNLPPLNAIKTDAGLDPDTAVQIEGLLGPYPPLADAALGIGVQSLWGEDSGAVRRVPLLLGADGTDAPGLALETARLAVKAPFVEVESGAGIVRLGAKSMRIEPGGTMRIHWSAPSHWTERTVSAIDVLQGKVPADRFAAAVVVVGSSALEVGAVRPTAMGALTPSVQVQAEAVEQLLASGAPYRPPWMGRFELLACLGLGCAASGLATFRGPLSGGLGVIGLIAAWCIAAAAAFDVADLLVDPVWPCIGAALAGNSAAGVSFARTRRLKNLIGQRFAQYLAPDLVKVILANPDRLKRDGELREVTALFTDIEGFTTMTSAIGPRALIGLLDPYFDGVCRIITDRGGMIDLIVGDAVHAFFNMPLDLPDHTDVALECALAIIDFTDAFRHASEAARAGFGRTRIGVETGPAIVGDVGGPGRFNYTAHGRVANSAARLEAANKDFGTSICVGPGAKAQARRVPLRRIGQTELRGIAGLVDLFTPEARSPGQETGGVR